LKPWERWLRKARAYRALFGTGERNFAQRAVIMDLARFCNMDKPSVRVSNGAVDVHATMVAEGRREVFLRIMTYASLSDDDLWKLARRAEDNQGEQA